MKAAIYCRLSEEDRGRQAGSDSLSIQNQKSMLLRYAQEKGWDVYGIYSDDDYAGADRNRPEFRRLIADAERRRFDIVLCKSQSRFTREMELVEAYLHGLFPAWGVRFVGVVDSADTAVKGNKKARQINGLVNEWYLEDMSESIKSALTVRRQQGLHVGAFALYGYRKDPEHRGRLRVDEEAAAVVREVFSLYALGYGKAAIARTLNDRGAPNPTEYKRRQGLNYRQPKNSTRWNCSAISNMLENECYIGSMVQGRCGSASYKTKANRPRRREEWFVVPGTHEPIVSRELWDSVQAQLGQRAKPYATGEAGIFAGVARCVVCGGLLCSCRSRGRRYLRCSSSECRGAFIAEEALERAVREELRGIADDCLCGVMPVRDTPDAHSAALEAEWQEFRRRAEAYERGIRALRQERTEGKLAQEDCAALCRDMEAEKARLERRAEDCAARIADIRHRGQADGVPGMDDVTLSREMVRVLIGGIRAGRRMPGTRETPVEIHWNF